MEQKQMTASLLERVESLERRLTLWRLIAGLGLLFIILAVFVTASVRSSRANEDERVLRVRGLVIEDSQGRPRILLGAPVPKVAGRKRQDETLGIILVGENGADRITIGVPTPPPQIGGKVVQRISPGAGLVVDDVDGNERGGIGVLDNGRGAVCLDYPEPVEREAVCLGILPEMLAGLLINAPGGDASERAMLGVLKDGTSYLKLADTGGNERSRLQVQGESPAQLLVLDPKLKTKVDVFEKIKP